uniref:Uncharacterized protein n=1 Tax=Oryza sativa subsp. japonica TaxID=39947 RepID=Q6Z691_ORYSJ|nr:hypothetical protein [Oryza sativa Japonica Group]
MSVETAALQLSGEKARALTSIRRYSNAPILAAQRLDTDKIHLPHLTIQVVSKFTNALHMQSIHWIETPTRLERRREESGGEWSRI